MTQNSLVRSYLCPSLSSSVLRQYVSLISDTSNYVVLAAAAATVINGKCLHGFGHGHLAIM